MKIAAVSFDHMHMGDLLRQAHDLPDTEIVGVYDDNPENKEAVDAAVKNFALPLGRVYKNLSLCLKETKPELVILCSSTARHAEYVEKLAPTGAHILVEKPFAASLAEADRMIAASKAGGGRLFINWPLAWYPPHITTKRLIDEGTIGEVLEVHYYDGNRGPTYHLADKIEVSEEEALRRTRSTWWYNKEQGGGSLLDYLGYGVTLGTWFVNGRKPIDVTASTWGRPGVEIDEHAICAVRYAEGLSKFETRWGTFTDPWVTQPQPKCGFVIVGSEGTIASYDYESTIALQTRDKKEIHNVPVDTLRPGLRGPIEHVLDVIRDDSPVHGPLDIGICRIGQQIVDTAIASAQAGRTLNLIEK